MSLPEWFGILVNVATMVASIAALLTILEMRRQRLTTYRPDITFARSHVRFYSYPDVGVGVPIACSSKPFDPASLDLAHAVPILFLKAYNVGLGSAKQVKANWRIDVDEWIVTLSQLDTEHQFRVWNDAGGVVSFEIPPGTPKFQVFRHSVMRDVPYLLPAAVSSDPVEIDVPFAYQQFLAIYVYLSLRRTRDGEQPDAPLPLTELELTYQDIGGNVHRKRFRVQPAFFYLATPGTLKEPELCGEAELRTEPL